MFLVRLVYASTKSDQWPEAGIEDILATAQANNPSSHVTGLLCFNRKYFLQCLEGSRDAVNTIYHHILNDTRHQDQVLLKYEETAARDFDSWSMGYVPESSLTSQVLLKYSGSSAFDPYKMSGDNAHRLLLHLSSTVATH